MNLRAREQVQKVSIKEASFANVGRRGKGDSHLVRKLGHFLDGGRVLGERRDHVNTHKLQGGANTLADVACGRTHRQDSRQLRVKEAGHPPEHEQSHERREAEQRQLVAGGEPLLEGQNVSGLRLHPPVGGGMGADAT